MENAYGCLPDGLKVGRVLEIGSYDVNGTTRNVFERVTEYLGVDLAPGPGVDLVSFGHKVSLPDGSFDITISAECFEHDEHWIETFKNMVRLTAPGGVVIFSCASSGRPEHGTRRSDPKLSPGTQDIGLDYYKNLNESDFRSNFDFDQIFSRHKFWFLKNHGDLYFIGQKLGDSREAVLCEFPSDEDIDSIRNLMSFPHKLARVPLRVANQCLSENLFQTFASRYWKYLTRIQQFALGDRFSR
jgi:SAM-dependent methyltransferase